MSTVDATEIQAKLIELDETIDAGWLLMCSFVVLMMQAGFAFLESGLLRPKNLQNVMLKNVLDSAIGAIWWMLIGYGIAFGTGGNPFIGFTNYGGQVSNADMPYFLFQYTFAATTSTIMSGAVAERISFNGYLIMCGLVNSFIYSFAAHWVWNPDGFLGKWGFFDFCGCGPVHIVGGTTALIGAWYLGPRLDKFYIDEDGKKRSRTFPMSSPTMALLGVFILSWGWFGFNGGATLRISQNWWKVVGLVVINTSMAGASGGIGGLFYSMFKHRKYGYVECMDIGNGILGGLVGITAAAPLVTFWEAAFIGFINAILVNYSIWAIERFHIVDDPVGASGVHAAGGFFGLLWVGFFADSYPSMEFIPVHGIFHHGNGLQLGKQLAGALLIFTWAALTCLAFFFFVDYCVVRLRIPEEHEIMGMDAAEHGIGKKDVYSHRSSYRPSLTGGIQGMSNQVVSTEEVKVAEIEVNDPSTKE